MQTSSNRLDDFNAEVTVTIPSAEVDDKFNANLEEAIEDINLPGFRKGKAPRNLIENKVDKEKVWAFTRQDLIEQTLTEAINKEDLNALSYDTIDQKPHAPGEDFTYSFKIRLMPAIPDFDHKDIPVKITKHIITEKNIDDAIDNLKINWADSSPITVRPAQEGDWALVHLVAHEMSRIKLPGQSDQPKQLFPPAQLTIELNGKRGIDWLDKEIISMNVKETKTAHLIMPKGFINPPLEQDTEIEAKITLLYLEEKKIPDICDEYLVENQIAKDMAEFRQKVRDELEQQAKQMENRQIVEAIHEWIIDNVKFDLPDDIIEAKKEEITERLRQEYHRQGQDLDDILKRVDEEVANLRDEINKQAIQAAKLDFVIPHIAEKEELQVTQPEIINHIQMIAQMSQIKKHQLKKLMEDEDFLIHSYRQILNRKVTNFLLNHAKKEYVEEKELMSESDADEPEANNLIKT